MRLAVLEHPVKSVSTVFGKMRFLLGLALALWTACAFAQTSPSASVAGAGPQVTRVATVNVNTSGSGLTIPPSFVGLSGEVADFVNGFYQGTSGTWTSGGVTGNAASFISLMNLLGSNGVMRLGGGTSDNVTAPTITSGMATNLNSFLTGLGSGWSLIYGLDLKANDTTTADTTAANIATAVGVSHVIFQMGNEPSLTGFTASTYETRWNTYYTAVSGAVSGARFGAIDDEMNIGFGNPKTVANALTPSLSGLQFLSQHWYSFCSGTWTSPAPDKLLQSVYLNQYSASLAGAGWLGAANQGAGYLLNQGLTGTVGQRMLETNSICGGGQTGMSDRLMASTWFLNTAMVLANNGWLGMNVHSGWPIGISVYNTAIVQPDQNFSPGAVFYGMYLFSKIEGQQILPSSVGGNANIAAIATKGVNGNANIIAVNNDPNSNVLFTPRQSGAWTTATVLLIKDGTGMGCSDTSLTVGGQPIGESGSWAGSSFNISNGQSITLSPCGSALIQIRS